MSIIATLTKSLTDKTVSLSLGLSEPAGNVKVRETVWNFGDGDSVTTGKQVREMSHTYATHGTYSVSVTVKDFHNRTATASTSVVIEAPYVEPPPPPPPPVDPMAGATWSATKTLPISGAYQNVSASGNRVLVCQGDGTAYTALSEDEGATFLPFVNRGTGASTFLEHPIALLGNNAALITGAKTTSFDLFGTRQAGDISIRNSTDGGKTFTAPFKFTTGKVAFRFGVVLDPANPDYRGVAWMHRRIVGASSTWDIEFSETYGGNVWSQPEVLFEGVQWVGGHRPSLYLSGGVLHMICFGEKIGKPPVAIDNFGRVLDPGTEVYHARRINGEWQGKFITNSPNYSGRPEMVVSGNTVVSVFDARLQSPGNDNDVGIVVSRDGGDSFSGIDYLRQGVGEATHPVLAKHSSGLLACAWNENIAGVQHNYIRFSTDDAVTWTPVQQISDVESGTPTIAFSDNYLHVIAGKRSGSGMTHRRFGPVG
jgi:PKD repeat protein